MLIQDRLWCWFCNTTRDTALWCWPDSTFLKRNLLWEKWRQTSQEPHTTSQTVRQMNWETPRGWGIKKYIFKASKKIFPWNPLESLVFYGPCNSLETKPSISVVFASFWKWSLSPVRFLQDIGPRNRAFAGLDAAVSTAPATLWSSNFWFSMVALKLTLV